MGSITINAAVYVPVYIGRDAGFSTSSNGACGYVSRKLIYYDNQYTFATAPVIWLNNNGTGVPPIGWYSLDAIAKYWDGQAFTSSVNCPNASPITLKVGGTSVGACSATSQTLYVQGGETFDTMTALYTDASLTVFAGNGYYSDGVNVREWQAPNMFAITVCLFATPVLLGEGLTAGAACSDISKSTFYVQSPNTFVNATRLYADSTLSILAPTGYYSDGNSSRYWDKVTFTFSPATICAAGYTSYNSATSNIATKACNSGTPRIIYILSTETFETATKIWNNSDGTGIPPINYYAYNGQVRYWDGNTLTAVRDCSSLIYYYTASQFSCPPDCGFISSGWIISSPTPLVGGKYYVGAGAVFICDAETTEQYATSISSGPYNSCGEASCSSAPTPYSWQFSSPGRTSSSLACAQTSFPLVLYTAENILEFGVQMYLNSDLTTPVGSGDLWYQEGLDGISYRIDNNGIIAEIITCYL